MQSVDKFIREKYVWKDFEDLSYGSTVLALLENLRVVGVKTIEEHRRELVERNFNQDKVHFYDYHFTLSEESGYIYCLESN